MSAKKKPMDGHRLAYTSFGVAVGCECGWRSNTWFGESAKRNAIGEWESHKEQCASEGKAA